MSQLFPQYKVRKNGLRLIRTTVSSDIIQPVVSPRKYIYDKKRFEQNAKS